jgi:methionyl aminopeptidase
MIILKSEEEVGAIEESCRLAASVLKETSRALKPGVKTSELDALAVSLMQKYGAVSAFKNYRGYPANICVSINEVVVHGIPGPGKLAEGDIVSLDVGVLKGGFYGDIAATYAVGRISAEAEKLVGIARQCLDEAIKAVNPSNRVGDVSSAVQALAEKNGYSVVRAFTGHGIGRSLHEDLQVPNFGKAGAGLRLKSGMTFCIEPMVNAGTFEVTVEKDNWTVVTKDRKLSAHFEAAVAVTENGVRVLACPEAE